MEANGKALIVGFYGMLPHVQIGVTYPSAPIPRMGFLLISGPAVPAGKYRITLSLKDPQGKELLGLSGLVPPIDQTVGAEPFNAIVFLQPMPLNGVGSYTVTAMVNGKPDFSGKLSINYTPIQISP